MSFIAQTIYNLFFYSYVLRPGVHAKILEQYLQHYKGSHYANSFAINFYDYLSQSKPVYTKNFQVQHKDCFLEWLEDPNILKKRVTQLSMLIRKCEPEDLRDIQRVEEESSEHKLHVPEHDT